MQTSVKFLNGKGGHIVGSVLQSFWCTKTLEINPHLRFFVARKKQGFFLDGFKFEVKMHQIYYIYGWVEVGVVLLLNEHFFTTNMGMRPLCVSQEILLLTCYYSGIDDIFQLQNISVLRALNNAIYTGYVLLIFEITPFYSFKFDLDGEEIVFNCCSIFNTNVRKPFFLKDICTCLPDGVSFLSVHIPTKFLCTDVYRYYR